MKIEASPVTTGTESSSLARTMASFPIACFTCALFTDIAYVQTMGMMWADFSDWLLAVGMAGGIIAALVGLVSLARHRSRDRARTVWPVVIGSLLVLAVALLNNFVHSRDAWTSVMPTGLALSAVTVVLIVVTAILDGKANGRRTVIMPYGDAVR